MDRELAQFCAAEFASAPRTDPGIQLEALRPIGLLPVRLVAPCLGHNLVLPVALSPCLLRCHVPLLYGTTSLPIIQHATISHAEARRLAASGRRECGCLGGSVIQVML